MSIEIKIDHVMKKYDKNVVIQDLSLDVQKGEFFTLLGSSGCGKTTLLRMIAGFNSIEAGTIYFDGKPINEVPIYQRNIGMVFQNYAVFPHLSVYENVAYGLKQRHLKKTEINERVMKMLDQVQIASLKDRMPSDMSGGQQQRIALARAIVISPDVLLFDEPLSNLDAKLRVEMRLAIKRLQNKNKITTIYVTHDQEEALSMSDRIAVMRLGKIQQVGTPIEIYTHPSNLFVATFIGQSNVFKGKIIEKNGAKLVDLGLHGSYEIPGLSSKVSIGESIDMVIRPTELTPKDNGENAIHGSIVERIFLGTQMRYTIALDGNAHQIEVHCDVALPHHEVGEKVTLGFNPEIVNVFSAVDEFSLMKGVNGNE